MTWFTCYQCNECCQKSDADLRDMGLDPDSDDKYDRMIPCPHWSENAIFERDEEVDDEYRG